MYFILLFLNKYKFCFVNKRTRGIYMHGHVKTINSFQIGRQDWVFFNPIITLSAFL